MALVAVRHIASRLKVPEAIGILRLSGPLARLDELAVVVADGARRQRWGDAETDGFPIPPRRYIVRVIGSSDETWYLRSGHVVFELIKELLTADGVSLDSPMNVLDFGCGCGRIARWWASYPRCHLYGTDYNDAMIAWCRRALPFGSFSRNELRPPMLQYPNEMFDVVYGYSVFTHLDPELEALWWQELARVLAADGRLILQFMGDEGLPEEGRTDFDAGRAVVQRGRSAGTNICRAYHPREHVEEQARRVDLRVTRWRPPDYEQVGQLALVRKA